jgi:hypothetical protein
LLTGGYLANEAEAPAWKRANENLALTSIAKCASRRIDARVHGGIGDDASLPNCIDQLLLADDAVAVLDEIGKQGENLRFHADWTVFAYEFQEFGIQSEAAESVDQGGVCASSCGNEARLNEQ